MIGTKLAHYEITSHLGTGGMGEVYQATDTKLGRNVAIKLLPEAFTHDRDREARFAREARVLASLNHPNIAGIYGVDESGGRKFLVMEFVFGETLEKRITRGRIPIDESLAIARQIAEALEAAHEKGVLHRDLKPANIKVTPGGQVKVLDFGLAKLLEDKSAEANLSQVSTMSGTLGGTILGTAAYMSPEQARGMEVGKTSDVWSFGCVLYEMLTGHKAFGGQTVTDILGSILKSEPDWNMLPDDTPPGIRKLLSRCLQKDQKHRQHDIADARIEIEESSREDETVRPIHRGWARPLPILGILLAFAATFLGGLYFRDSPEAKKWNVEINTPPTTSLGSFEVSPNGRELVFVATLEGQPRLFLRQLDTSAAEPLPRTEGASFPFWKPNGESIGFFAGFSLKRIDLADRVVQTITNSAPGTPGLVDAHGASWSKDGIIVFGPNVNTPLYQVNDSGGSPVPVTRLDPSTQRNHSFPVFLPDGQHFVFFAQGSAEGQGVYLGSLQSLDVRWLFGADQPAVFIPSGYLLFIKQGALFAQGFDARKLEPIGKPVAVAPSANFVSASGDVIAYRRQVPSVLTWFDRSGNPIRTIGDFSSPQISRDDKLVAAQQIGADGNIDVVVLDATTGARNRITRDPAVEGFPIFSLDSKSVVFASEKGHSGRPDIIEMAADGNGEATLLVAASEGTQPQSPLGFSPDGRYFLFARGGSGIYRLELTSDGKPAGTPIAVSNTNGARNAQFSPDGQWVIYQSSESGINEVYALPFPGPGTRQQITFGGGTQVRWPSQSKELIYMGVDNKLYASPVAPAADGRSLVLGPRTVIAPNLRGASGAVRQSYDVSSDGKRILMRATTEDKLTPPIEMILNWKPPSK